MIHSMCGGGLKDNALLTFVKVSFLDCPACEKRPYWYVCPFVGIAVGDTVLAPYGRDGALYKAEVLRVDENVSEQTPPFPLSSMKEIVKIGK